LGVDALVVTRLPNVRYLTGFTGSNGQVVLTPAETAFYTDGRYTEQSRREAPDLRRGTYTSFPEALAEACKELEAKRVAFEAEGVTYRLYQDLSDKLEGIELLPVRDEVERLRWIKEPEEIRLLDEAQALTDETFDRIVAKLTEGMTELEVAIEMELTMRQAGAEGLAFDTIVAFGESAAEPHHHPTDRPLRRGDVVKMDFGAVAGGYHADMTRTVAFGEPSAKAREIYEVVRAAQQAGIDGVRAGVRGRDPDEAARAVIREAGYGEQFSHSLGHGVGLEVHEGPSLRWTSDDVLPVSTVVTVEPGIYVAGVGGVRIEDMVEVTAEGCRVLPRSTKELLVL